MRNMLTTAAALMILRDARSSVRGIVTVVLEDWRNLVELTDPVDENNCARGGGKRPRPTEVRNVFNQICTMRNALRTALITRQTSVGTTSNRSTAHDIMPALQESKKGEWNGDPDLQDSKLEQLREEYDKRVKLCNDLEKERGRDSLQERIQELITHFGSRHPSSSGDDAPAQLLPGEAGRLEAGEIREVVGGDMYVAAISTRQQNWSSSKSVEEK
ncbi:Hypp9415 [Branchiostoma lanceolatum]|uniref:Hypp9415 protein n=1 Tax=Branchiostoma lanceolatum TaxID=7740 RepID=A0A8S4MLT8_BRALA|nr:Hypp9415 [Branchiostoma lanceolatum]